MASNNTTNNTVNSTINKTKIGNGSLPLVLRKGKFYEVHGGPFPDWPDESHIGVKMAKEIKLDCDIDIPTLDFSVPNKDQLDNGLIRVVEELVKGHPVYVGCMAGRGRTGLFLSILAKAFGEKQPVEYVRDKYYAHAVETPEQYEFVSNYEIPVKVKSMLFWARLFSYFSFKNNLTNRTALLYNRL